MPDTQKDSPTTKSQENPASLLPLVENDKSTELNIIKNFLKDDLPPSTQVATALFWGTDTKK